MVSPTLKWEELLGEVYGEEVLYMGGTNNQIMPKERSITNAFFNNLNTVTFFCNHVTIFT